MTPWYIATEKFAPSSPGWAKFVAWAKLPQLVEVITLDGMLCPTVLPEIKDEYWPHIVNEDFNLNFFIDYEYLAEAVKDIPEKNVLCVFRNPESDPRPPGSGDYRFVGYDVCDKRTHTSALMNCGGWPGVFSEAELSVNGLILERKRAFEIQRDLLRKHPEESHADCNAWAIFRKVAEGSAT